MGTHPIFESDFDCLTDQIQTWYSIRPENETKNSPKK